jgi:hypothetical protein
MDERAALVTMIFSDPNGLKVVNEFCIRKNAQAFVNVADKVTLYPPSPKGSLHCPALFLSGIENEYPHTPHPREVFARCISDLWSFLHTSEIAEYLRTPLQTK